MNARSWSTFAFLLAFALQGARAQSLPEGDVLTQLVADPVETRSVSAPRVDSDTIQGRKLYESRCRTCHGGTAPADSSIGPSLSGIVGTRAGTQASGVHSRALIDSGIVWDRDSLRRFLSDPQRAIPGTHMPVGVADSVQLESLLDYLESLR